MGSEREQQFEKCSSSVSNAERAPATPRRDAADHHHTGVVEEGGRPFSPRGPFEGKKEQHHASSSAAAVNNVVVPPPRKRGSCSFSSMRGASPSSKVFPQEEIGGNDEFSSSPRRGRTGGSHLPSSF